MDKLISGKVREVYELDDNRLVIVTTDRISAFDVVLSKPVSDKGRILNAISLFWFDHTKDLIPNHILSADLSNMPAFFQTSEFQGRTVLVKKLAILPFEFIVRGYMFGSMWASYTRTHDFCGQAIHGAYQLAEKLETPMFTPSTKAHAGHDEYISFQQVVDTLGSPLANEIREACLNLYDVCSLYAREKGIIIADTKFEFGLDAEGNLVLADEIFTPDSSRFWSLADYAVGRSPKSYDKQFVRDWLVDNKVNGQMQFDNVPDDVLRKTAKIYHECFRRLC